MLIKNKNKIMSNTRLLPFMKQIVSKSCKILLKFSNPSIYKHIIKYCPPPR